VAVRARGEVATQSLERINQERQIKKESENQSLRTFGTK
jgi:hypothetical protein